MSKQFSRKFYASKIWRQQRLFALSRDQYSCRDCGGRAEEVHHQISLDSRNISDYSIALGLDNLVSLCFDCHQKRHKGVSDVPEGMCFDDSGHVIKIPPG
jgi:5-methylcytosine-specific restriction endonuclease McrA